MRYRGILYPSLQFLRNKHLHVPVGKTIARTVGLAHIAMAAYVPQGNIVFAHQFGTELDQRLYLCWRWLLCASPSVPPAVAVEIADQANAEVPAVIVAVARMRAGAVFRTTGLNPPVRQYHVVITNVICFLITDYTKTALLVHLVYLFSVHHAPLQAKRGG